MNLDEFKKFLDRLKLGFTENDKHILLKKFDANGDGQIDYDEFLDFLHKNKLDDASETKEEKPGETTPRGVPAKTLTMNQSVVAINYEEKTQADKEFEEILNSFPPITKDDYFAPDKTTILNSQNACLKRCNELVKQFKSQKKDAFDDPDFGPTPKDSHGKFSIYNDEAPAGN